MLQKALGENIGYLLSPQAWFQARLGYSDGGFGFGFLQDIQHSALASAVTALPTL